MATCFCTGRCYDLGYCPTSGNVIAGRHQAGRVIVRNEPSQEEIKEIVREVVREELDRDARRRRRLSSFRQKTSIDE